MLKRRILISFFSIMLFFSFMSGLFASQQMDKEIEHLISYVTSTSCKIDRNGVLHAGERAAMHIKEKYSHYKSRISSTEQFIELSASRSMMSGMAYRVKCAGKKDQKMSEWLKAELAQYKKTK